MLYIYIFTATATAYTAIEPPPPHQGLICRLLCRRRGGGIGLSQTDWNRERRLAMYIRTSQANTLSDLPVCQQCIFPLGQFEERVTINNEAVGLTPTQSVFTSLQYT